MIGEPTLFILGAGASAPYGYPTSYGLWERIVGRYPENSPVAPMERRSFREFYSGYLGRNPETSATQEKLIVNLDKFHNSFFGADPSIDRFISRNLSFEDLGKKAIITMLFHAEQYSALPETLGDRGDDWLTYLLREMTRDIVQSDKFATFHDNDVTFITFNYDRSLEQLTYNYLSSSFSELPDEAIVNAIEGLRILHVNGVLAPLPWQKKDGIKQEYRKALKTVDIHSHVQNIQIIYDQQSNDTKIEIDAKLRAAKRIFFLGFGYADENMKLLGFPEILEPNQQIHGTTKGFVSHEVDHIINLYFVAEKKRLATPHLTNQNCLELLRNNIFKMAS
ncbi:MAG: hypothetical protein IH971_05085 [Candidatus Marinimicrobia bacterium]|nr:hypothetical protein [Candidatus Neomarinimicrobiota bacterium]